MCKHKRKSHESFWHSPRKEKKKLHNTLQDYEWQLKQQQFFVQHSKWNNWSVSEYLAFLGPDI